MKVWGRLKPLLVGLAVAAVIFITGFVALQLAMSDATAEEVGRIGMLVYLAWAVVMLLFPAFVAGYVAKSWGAAYGVVLAAVPIFLWSLVNSGFPIAFYLAYVGIAAVGGYFGQVVSNKRHAS